VHRRAARHDHVLPTGTPFLGLLLTCAKLGISFWDYLGHRLGLLGADVPYLPDLVRLRSAHP
jgi:hypothetical protein